MTRVRVFGEDVPFCAWIRRQPDLDSRTLGLTVNDIDLTLHRYKSHVDGLGTRDVQFLMNVEVKTRGALPDFSQRETLWFTHQRLRTNGIQKMKPVYGSSGHKLVWHFGVFVLSLSGQDPDDSKHIEWLAFNEDGKLKGVLVTTDELRAILGMTVDPQTQRKIDLRRHHKTTVLTRMEPTALGFEVATIVTSRS